MKKKHINSQWISIVDMVKLNIKKKWLKYTIDHTKLVVMKNKDPKI